MIYPPELIGWLSTLCLAACGIPLAIEAYKQGRSNVNNRFFSLWLAGEIFGVIHTYNIQDYPLLANYTFNTLVLIFVLRYKLFPRK